MKLSDKDSLKAFLTLHNNVSTKDEAKYVLENLLNDKDNWHLADNHLDFFLDAIYCAIGGCYFVLEQWNDAIKAFDDGLSAANKRWPEYGYNNKHRLYYYLSLCFANKLDKGRCLDAYRKAVYYEIKLSSNVSYPHFDFYTFRNTKSFAIADLKENKISFSSLFDFNDPVDSAYFACVDRFIEEETNPVNKLLLEVRREAYSHLRAKCFITSKHLPNQINYRPSSIDIPPYMNTLMWSHYASYHNGYCAMYNFPTEVTQIEDSEGFVLKVGEINYVEELQYPNSLDFNTGFFTKSKRWEYEHEKRICYYSLSDTPSHPEVRLPQGCLKEVYLGLRCDAEYEIYDALRDKPDVKVFKMILSKSDIYSLEAEEMDRAIWNPTKPINEGKTKEKCVAKRVWSCLKKSIKNDCKGL